MGRYSGKTCRLLTMLSMTASFFLVEIIVGYITNSIALVADSFHMLSDVVSLIVGFAAVRIAKWPTQRNTYGWVRAEVLGALINAVFLVALCFSILVEALKRLVEVEEIEDPKLLLIVGGLGLLVNIIGLVLFHDHGHSHGGGGHGHSHGSGHSHGDKKNKGHGHSHDSEDHDADRKQENSHESSEQSPHIEKEDAALMENGGTSDADRNAMELELKMGFVSTVSIEMDDVPSSSQLNMRGVFLHVLGDALGSVIVVISALLIWFVEGKWKYYMDPAMSIGMVLIILCTTFPLLRDSAHILLQTVPSHVDLVVIKEKIRKVPGIQDVHEFHVWQLSGSKLIASVHVSMQNNDIHLYMDSAAHIKRIFHKSGIHSYTIQPEFKEDDEIERERKCILECSPDQVCHPDTCCPQRKLPEKSKESNNVQIV